MWKEHLDPQITARNRWAGTGEAGAGYVRPARCDALARPARRQVRAGTRRAALVTVLGGIATAGFMACMGPTEGLPSPTAGIDVVAPAQGGHSGTIPPAHHGMAPGGVMAE